MKLQALWNRVTQKAETMNAIIDAALSHARTVLASLVLILISVSYTHLTLPTIYSV